jgi:hypothetical protein
MKRADNTAGFALLCGVLLVGLMSCDNVERTEQLASLELVLHKLDSAEQVYRGHLLEEGVRAKRATDSLLQHVDMALLGREVTRQQAEPFNGLAQRRRLLKDQRARQRRIDQELSRTRKQVTGLSEAIRIGAATDAQGTTIDAPYLKKAVDDETLIARHLIEEMAATTELLERGLMGFDSLEAAVTSWLENDELEK